MKGKFKAKKAIVNPESGGLYFLRKNMWWVVDKDDNPIYFDGMHPQCNSNDSVTKNIFNRYKNNFPPGCKVKFYENIFESRE